MLFKSEKDLSGHRVLAILSLTLGLAPIALATITVTPSRTGGTQDGILYFAAGPLITPTTQPVASVNPVAFIDSGDVNLNNGSFGILDLSKGQADEAGGSRTNMVELKINSDRLTTTGAVGITNYVVLTVNGANGGSPRPVPIAAIEGNDCASAGCVWQNAYQPNSQPTGLTNGHYFAAPVPPNVQSFRVGFYPKDLCADYYALSANTAVAMGCDVSGATVNPEPAPSALPALQINVAIGAVNATTGLSGSSIDSTVNPVVLRFQQDSPVLNCPSPADQWIYPGDRSVRVDANSLFAITTGDTGTFAPDRAPRQKLIVVAKVNATPNTTSNYAAAGVNDIVKRLDFGARTWVDGFTNSTAQTQVNHQLVFMIRDAAGLVAHGSGQCSVSGVQAAAIYGAMATSRCFIATAAAQSADAWDVLILRKFREKFLLKFGLGKQMVRFYYRNSPPIAEQIIEHDWLRFPVRAALFPIVLLSSLIVFPVLGFGFLSLVAVFLIWKFKLGHKKYKKGEVFPVAP